MKTRSNMPLFVVECTNIKALSNSQIDLLRCGDYLVKKTGKQEHAYKVAYKQDDEMALIYCDYHNIEEVYYEKNAQGNWAWVSTENKNLDSVPSVSDVNTQIANLVEGGTLENAKPLYFHPITIYRSETDFKCLFTMIIINNDSTPFTKTTLINYLHSHTGRYLINGAYNTSTFYLSPAMVNKLDTEGAQFMVVGFDNLGTYHSEGSNSINFETIVSGTESYGFKDEVNKIN